MKNSKSQDSSIIVFQLTKSGNLISITQDQLIEHLISINIIYIYSISKKHAFIWVGKNARRELKGQIQTIEPKFKKEFPRFTILRHFTIDESQEPPEFFQALSIDKKELEKSRDKWREFRLEIYSQIDDLKIKLNSNQMIGQLLKTEEQAKEIVDLAKKVHDDGIINEYMKYLSEIEQKKEMLVKRQEYLDKIPTEIEKINNLMDSNSIEEAFQKSEQIEEWYRTIIDQTVPSDTQNILSPVKLAYEKLIKTRKEIEEKKEKLEKSLNQEEFPNAHSLRQEIDQLYSNELKQDLPDDLVSLFAKEQEAYEVYLIKEKERIAEEREINEYKQKIELFYEKLSQMESSHDYNSIITNLEDLLSISTAEKVSELKEKLENQLKNSKLEQDLWNEKLELFKRLKSNIEDAQKNKNWSLAIKNTIRIIEICKEIEKEEEMVDYQSLLTELEQQSEQEQQAQLEKHEKLISQAKELEEIIEVSNEVLPLVTNISVDDVLGDLSSDVNQMLDQISTVLDSHRVEVKTEMASKSTIQTASGEVIEFNQTTSIEMMEAPTTDSENAQPQKMKFIVNSGIENTLNESIEEAIIEDIIPYNYEISEINLNGEVPDQEPEQILTENGLTVQWTLKDIAPKEKVDIHYDLQRRVSRTIILPLESELKIIKTHTNIKGMDKEGLFDAQLKFANQFHRQLDGLVIEDIIPSFYLYDVKKPEDEEITSEVEESTGSLVKWNLTSIPEDHIMLHWYLLINMYYFEELKIQAKQLVKDGLKILDSGKISDSMKKFDELIELLKSYQ